MSASRLTALRGCQSLVSKIRGLRGSTSSVTSLTLTQIRGLSLSAARKSGGAWLYRSAPAAPGKKYVLYGDLVGGFMWWWILWHVFTEPEHIYGEYPIVHPEAWTDEELGIPPDSAGPAPRIK